MKKILLFTSLLISLYGFGQFNSDREAYLSLLNKLQKDQKKIYENSTSTVASTVNFEMINGVEKLISLKFSESLSDDIRTPNEETETIDLTPELKQFNLAESLVLVPNAYRISSNNTTVYKINFEEFNNSKNLTTLVFKTISIDHDSSLQIINLNKLRDMPNLSKLGLHSLLIDYDIFSVLESTNQYNIKEFSISPFKPYNEYVNDFTFSGFKNSLEKLTIEGFNGNLNNIFFSDLPNLKSFTHIGNFNIFPDNLNNSHNLEYIYLQSYNNFNTLPSQISDLKNLKDLTIITNQLNLPENFSNLKNLKSFQIKQNTIDGLEAATNIIGLENLTVSLYNTINKSLNLQNLVNLKKLVYKYNSNSFENLHLESYILPNGIENLLNIEHLDISLGKTPININNLVNLKKLSIEYMNDELFPKIDFSKNTNLEYLLFKRFYNDFNINNLKTPRIKFDKEFDKLTNLSWIDFQNVPIEMNVTNKFNHLFNKSHQDPNTVLLKYLAFNNLKSNIPNKLDGILNICNDHDIYLDIRGSSPEIIDFRNKPLTNSSYFYLNLKENKNPLIIVDDINKFKQTYGETYHNSLTQTNVSYNLTTSSEPCERNLSTNDLIKSNVKIYPNPVVDILNIETDINKNSIKIIDFTGKVIESYIINEKKVSVIVNHLPKGIYIIQIENEKEKTILKFIKK